MRKKVDRFIEKKMVLQHTLVVYSSSLDISYLFIPLQKHIFF